MSNLQDAAALRATPRTFIDLRQFAQDAHQGIVARPSTGEDPFLANRRLLDFPAGPVTAGALALQAGSGTVSSQPVDEFIIVSEGTLTLTQQGRTLVLGPQDSAVIQHGAAFAWSAEGPVSVIFMRYHDSQPEKRAIVPIAKNPEMGPSGGPAAELLLTPAPACRNHTDHVSSDGVFICGTWDSTPYHRRAMTYRIYELMYLLEGSVTFVDETGRSATFSRGDIFIVEQGVQCSWESREKVAKVYAIYRPA
ncbi:MAG: cupin domain-containing protein [Rhodocyclaceae bacterium]